MKKQHQTFFLFNNHKIIIQKSTYSDEVKTDILSSIACCLFLTVVFICFFLLLTLLVRTL